MSIKARLVCVTNQDELDRALEAAPDDEVAIEIRSDPGKYVPNYLFVADSRGHYIEARGESRVVVSNTAEIVATDHSQVEVYDESIVAAIGGAQVNWRGHSTGSCGHYARGQVWDEASVSTYSEYPLLAFDDATVTVGGVAHVVAQGRVSVTARDHAVVEMSGDVDVTAQDQVVIHCEGGEVYARDHVTVYVAKYADMSDVEGTPTVVVHDFKGDTPVTGGAVVVAG